MTSIKNLLIHLMLDRRDATTLRHAGWLAQAVGPEVIYVAHIAPSFDLPAELAEQSVTPVDEEIVAQLKTALADQQPDLFPSAARVECLAREGPFPTELVRLAAHKSADLICLGRLRPEDQDPVSDAAAVLVRKSPCSVFLVPEGAEPNPKRILVPIDFSAPSRGALEFAIALATATAGASLTLLHVYPIPIGYARAGFTYEQMAARVQKVVEANWLEMQTEVDFRGVPWTIRYQPGDFVAATILAVATEIDAELIVMGSHGRTVPAAALLGHVADSVCSKTTRPFLCVKRKGQVVSLLRAMLQLYEPE